MLPSSSDALPLPASPTLLLAALDYRSRGWSIIPVVGKVAAGLWKPFQEHPADDNTLRSMFARPGVTGLAVVCGAVSGGLAIRDYDVADGYHAWAAAHPVEAATLPTVQTAQGFHVYGILDADQFATLGDGELRADSGHYTLLPPSLHPSGIAYRWMIPLPDGALPPLPASLSQRQATHATHDDSGHPCHTLHTLVSDGRIQTAIQDTLPSGHGQRNECLFDLARSLKAVVPAASRDELRAIAREWHRQALPHIATKDFTTSWSEFSAAWGRVRVPRGAVLAEVLASAAANPLPAVAHQYDLPAMQQLVALCAALQAHHGPGRAWPLSCRLAAEKVGVSHDTAARLLNLLVDEDVLELATPGGKKGSRRAAEYRFIEPAQGGTRP